MKTALLSVLAAIAAAGCSSTPTPRQANVAQPAGCVSTGSRVAQDKNRCAGFGRSYSSEELRQTGHVDVARALQQLDPSIQ
jgi:hypothetical protein